MKCNHGYKISSGQPSPLPCLLILALFFLAGIVLGQVVAGQISASVSSELSQYLSSYYQLERGETGLSSSLLSALLLYFRYPVLAFLLGFASIGFLLLPCVTLCYGFFLSFSICCYIATFGPSGAFLAAAVFGLRCLVTVPCYFCLAVASMGASASLANLTCGRVRRMVSGNLGKSRFLLGCICTVILLIGVCFEWFLEPWLLHTALGYLLA